MCLLQLAGAEMAHAYYSTRYRFEEEEEEQSDDESDAGETFNRHTHALDMEEVNLLPSLRALLDALLAPHMPLRHLSMLFGVTLTPAAVAGCGRHLAGLTSLDLFARRGNLPQAAGLQALLEQAPHVVAFKAVGLNMGGPLPSCLAERPLRALRLDVNSITHLLDGPYLSGKLQPCC